MLNHSVMLRNEASQRYHPFALLFPLRCFVPQHDRAVNVSPHHKSDQIRYFCKVKITDLNISPEISDLLQKYFDKIFVVTIPRFADRQQRMNEHLQGLSFEYFYGADKL